MCEIAHCLGTLDSPRAREARLEIPSPSRTPLYCPARGPPWQMGGMLSLASRPSAHPGCRPARFVQLQLSCPCLDDRLRKGEYIFMTMTYDRDSACRPRPPAPRPPRREELGPATYTRPYLEDSELMKAIEMHTGLPAAVVSRLCLRYGVIAVATSVPACTKILEAWFRDAPLTTLGAIRAEQNARGISEDRQV
jgi:hypothetical protein